MIRRIDMSGVGVRWIWEDGFNQQMTQPNGRMGVASVKCASRKSPLETRGLPAETQASVASAISKERLRNEKRKG